MWRWSAEVFRGSEMVLRGMRKVLKSQGEIWLYGIEKEIRN